MTTETNKKPDTAGNLLMMAAYYSAGWAAANAVLLLVKLFTAAQ